MFVLLSLLLFLSFQQSKTHLLIFSIFAHSPDAFSVLSALSSVYLSCVLASYKAASSSAMITMTFLSQSWQKKNTRKITPSDIKVYQTGAAIKKKEINVIDLFIYCFPVQQDLRIDRNMNGSIYSEKIGGLREE